MFSGGNRHDAKSLSSVTRGNSCMPMQIRVKFKEAHFQDSRDPPPLPFDERSPIGSEPCGVLV